MRKSIYTYAILLAMPVVALLTSCEPRGLKEDDVFVQEGSLDEVLKAENPNGYKIYSLNEFLDTYMTEKGNFASDTCPYRDRSHDSKHDLYMFTVDTLPTGGAGIYIRGRVTTDDYAGNFYKSMVIQQIGDDGKQQNLRISVDLGSVGGLYQIGQEILIRCNGLAVGRYANQPQLCVPAYNNNIYAMNASQKVGWAPGRIESSVFRAATRMIGAPDVNKLQYDTLTLTQLFAEVGLVATPDAAGMDKIRKADGRLVVIKDVWFTGEYDNNGTLAKCDTLHPDSSSNANVFAPTTNNIGYPQGRVISDGTNKLMCSNSEYAKFAYYYLPGADRHGVDNCPNWKGTVTGILGWYEDKASDLADGKQKGYEWSVTPRGIPGIGVADVNMKNDHDDPWIPKEFNPNDYQ